MEELLKFFNTQAMECKLGFILHFIVISLFNLK